VLSDTLWVNVEALLHLFAKIGFDLPQGKDDLLLLTLRTDSLTGHVF
jgi:hypothetical protein